MISARFTYDLGGHFSHRYFDSVEADVEATFERITGESLANLRGPRAGAAKSTKSRPAVRRSRAD